MNRPDDLLEVIRANGLALVRLAIIVAALLAIEGVLIWEFRPGQVSLVGDAN